MGKKEIRSPSSTIIIPFFSARCKTAMYDALVWNESRSFLMVFFFFFQLKKRKKKKLESYNVAYPEPHEDISLSSFAFEWPKKEDERG